MWWIYRKSHYVLFFLPFTDGVTNILCPEKTFIDGYFMLTPVRYVECVEDLTKEEIVSIFKNLKFLLNGLRLKNEKLDGFDLLANRGIKAGQHVPHVHFHIIPRYSDEKFSDLFDAVKNPSKYGLSEIILVERVEYYREYLADLSNKEGEKETNGVEAEKDSVMGGDVISSGEFVDFIFPEDSNIKYNFVISPKRMVLSLENLNEDEVVEFIDLVKRVTEVLEGKMSDIFAGYNLMVNSRKNKYNSFESFNIRYVPRFENEKGNPLKVLGDTSKVDIMSEKERGEAVKSHKDLFDEI